MRAVVIIITAALCCAGGARAETVTVQPGDSIQAAIDGNANGTEIVLLPGTYHELIDLRGRAVTIRSSDPEDRDVVLDTVIDGSGLDGSVITCATGEGPDTRLEGLTITGGEGTVRGMYRVGGGLYNYLASPTVTNCVFLENHADGGGGIWNFYGYAVISGCEFRANTNGFSSYGGAAIENQGGAPVIINCKFMDNSTPTRGGAIHNTNSTDPTIVNCIFARNSASYGGAILNASGDVTLVNCTLIDNVADSVDDATGGGLCVYDASQTVIYNCILRGNSPSQIGMFPGSTPEVSYSNIEDGWSGDGSDNIDVDPAFVDPESDDLRLRSESLCVDAGEENMLPEYATMDLGGNARVVNVTVDVGAYELQEEPDPPAPSTDLNGDGLNTRKDHTMNLSSTLAAIFLGAALGLEGTQWSNEFGPTSFNVEHCAACPAMHSDGSSEIESYDDLWWVCVSPAYNGIIEITNDWGEDIYAVVGMSTDLEYSITATGIDFNDVHSTGTFEWPGELFVEDEGYNWNGYGAQWADSDEYALDEQYEDDWEDGETVCAQFNGTLCIKVYEDDSDTLITTQYFTGDGTAIIRGYGQQGHGYGQQSQQIFIEVEQLVAVEFRCLVTLSND